MAEPRTIMEFGPNGPKVAISDYDELYTWLANERGHWAPLMGANPDFSAATRLTNGFDSLYQRLADFQRQGEPVHVGASEVLSRFRPGSTLTYSESLEGEAILLIAQTIGASEAAFAWATTKQQVSMAALPASPTYMKAMMMLAMPSLVATEALETRLRNERERYRSHIRSLTDRVEAQEAKQARTFSESAQRQRRLLKRGWRRAASLFTQAQAKREEAGSTLNKLGLDVVASLRGTEQTYKEQMELQAPVDYWRKKAEKHREGRKLMLTLTCIYFVIAIVVLSLAFVGVGGFLVSKPNLSNAALVVSGAGLATVSGLFLWIGRLVTRLYLSEHHLLHDAEERAVMTTTYLALTAERAAADADRQIVLNALFRSTSDGIVKDDGSADLSLGALISRVLANPK